MSNYHGHGNPTYLAIAILVLTVWCALLTLKVIP